MKRPLQGGGGNERRSWGSNSCSRVPVRVGPSKEMPTLDAPATVEHDARPLVHEVNLAYASA